MIRATKWMYLAGALLGVAATLSGWPDPSGDARMHAWTLALVFWLYYRLYANGTLR